MRPEPQLEVSYGWIASLFGAGFDPVAIYGRDRFWSVSVAVRVGLGMSMHRMGRYGAVEGMASAMGGDAHMH